MRATAINGAFVTKNFSSVKRKKRLCEKKKKGLFANFKEYIREFIREKGALEFGIRAVGFILTAPVSVPVVLIWLFLKKSKDFVVSEFQPVTVKLQEAEEKYEKLLRKKAKERGMTLEEYKELLEKKNKKWDEYWEEFYDETAYFDPSTTAGLSML